MSDPQRPVSPPRRARVVAAADYPHFADKLAARMVLIRAKLHELLSRSQSGLAADQARDVHDAKDDAFVERLADLELAEMRHEMTELRDIESAQRRIRQGNYGSCSDCGTAIDWERLEAWPTAERCVECQARHEASP